MKKLTCDLCGGTLEINRGGKGATCVECGLTYSMEHLREKLGIGAKEKTVEEKKEEKYVPIDEIEIELPDENKEEVIYSGSWEAAEDDVTYEGEWVIESDDGDVVNGGWEPAAEVEINGQLLTKADISKVPAGPFSFTVSKIKGNTLTGKVIEGYAQLGNRVSIGSAFGPSVEVTYIDRLDDDSILGALSESVCKGMNATLTVNASKRDLKSAHMLFGKGEVKDYFPTDIYGYWGKAKDYFADLLLLHFCDYDIYKDCTLTDENIKADFALCKDGEIKLAIFLFGTGDKTENRVNKILGAVEKSGIPTLRFIPNFRNNVNYVNGRIKKALKK